MPKCNDLTLKQRLFCEHYLSNGYNGLQAAVSAGYSKRSAKELAHFTLTNHHVKKYIEKRMIELTEKVGLTAEYRLKKLRQGLDMSIPDILDTDDSELRIAKLKTIDVRAGVACIAEANKMDGSYAPISSNVSVMTNLESVKEESEKLEKENEEVSNLNSKMKEF